MSFLIVFGMFLTIIATIIIIMGGVYLINKEKERAMAIKKCNCKHEFQDTRYGKFMRVMNKMKNGLYRCTVCLKEHE